MKEYDVCTIGNALMDFLIEVDETVLQEFSLEKGRMHLIDAEQSRQILATINGRSMVVAPGGCAANTAFGVALLGGTAAFCGKVGSDEYGRLYEEQTNHGKVKTVLGRAEALTGHAVTFISPDAERTFAVHLGAAAQLCREDISAEDIAKSKILHVEGYLLEGALKEAALHAMATAKENDTKVSIDLGDPLLVQRNRAELKQIVADYADIVFANEEEAKAFTGKGPEEAAAALGDVAGIAVVKLGERGSLIWNNGKTIRVEPFPAKPVDTTGAGDMYAAGFLYGLCRDWPLERAGMLGSLMGAKVVSQIGARLDPAVREDIFSVVFCKRD